VQSACPRGWKGFLRSHRKHDAVAAQLLVSIVQDDMQVWHKLALHIPCHACTHIHGDQDAHLLACTADIHYLVALLTITFAFVLFCWVFFHFYVFPGDTTGTLYLQVAIKRGNHLCYWAHKTHGLSHWGYQDWGRQITLYINSCVRNSTWTTRGSGTSNMVWFITLLLWALLLDELWTRTCLAKTVKTCIEFEVWY